MLNWWDWHGDFNPIHRLACAKGGHGSGTVAYADYIEYAHSLALRGSDPNDHVGADTISQSFIDTLNTALAATPYTDASRPSGAQYPDPDTDIAAIATELGEFDALADGLDPATDWDAYVDAILTKLGDASLFPAEDIIDSLSTKITAAITAATSVLSSAPVTSAVTAHENAQMNRFMRSTGRWAAGMADINAVQTSSFIIGLALRESEFQYQMEDFQANLNLDIYRSSTSQALEKYLSAVMQRHGNRDLYLTKATSELLDLLRVQVAASQESFKDALDHTRQKTVIKAEEANYNLTMDLKEATWDIDLFTGMGNFIGAPGAGTYIPDPIPAWQSVVGSIFGGVSAAAQLVTAL